LIEISYQELPAKDDIVSLFFLFFKMSQTLTTQNIEICQFFVNNSQNILSVNKPSFNYKA